MSGFDVVTGPTPEGLAWCRQHFGMMADRGMWAVPRSGLIFQRQDGELVLVNRMPWTQELADAAAAGQDVPPTAGALAAYQAADYETIRARFEAAGITTRSEVD